MTIRLLGLVLLACACYAPTASAQSMDDYKKHCSTTGGRQLLLGLIDPPTRHDLEQQAHANGIPVDAYLSTRIKERCALFAPGSVTEPKPEPMAIFSAEDIGAPLPGETIRTLRGAKDPPRCGPSCEGGFTVEHVHPRWDACRIRYRSIYENQGPHMPSDVVGAAFEVRPTAMIDEARFRGFQFNGTAHERSFIEVRDLELDLVVSDLSIEDRLAHGCIVQPKDHVERVGQSECKEDRSGFRHSDSCTITHRAVGARRYVYHPWMRKVIIRKPSGDTGEETVEKQVNGKVVGTLVVRPGQTIEIFSPPGETQTRRVSVDIKTSKTGATGISSYSLHTEWQKP